MSLTTTITGTSDRHIRILLINPNATPAMTQACLAALQPTLPPSVSVTGFTAPHPGPTAIEGHVDAVLSAAAALRAVAPLAHAYDAFLVACYSAHPLIPALREEVAGPVVGIMEASLYAARILGGRLGVATTGYRSKLLLEDAIRAYGLAGFSVGCEATGLGVLELESKPKEEVTALMRATATRLVEGKGADCVALGCAGMVEMREACEDAVGGDGTVCVIDGVGVGVQFLVGLVREGYKTAKGGIYSSAAAGRAARGQDWL